MPILLTDAFSNLMIVFCVVTTASYLLSQMPVIRRWLGGRASQGDICVVMLMFGSLSIVSGALISPYREIIMNTSWIGPAVGGLYGGPAVGLGAGLIEWLEHVFVSRQAAPGGFLLGVLVGLVSGVLSRLIKEPRRTRTSVLVAIISLALHFLIFRAANGWRTPPLNQVNLILPVYGVTLLGTVLASKIFNNELREVAHKEILEHLAVTDGLTKLYNHRYFHTQIAKELERARDGDGKLALVLLDLDLFKQFNDTFGHPCGDQLLAAIGEQLRRVVRSSDSVSRYGGDEFAIILPDADFGTAQGVAHRAQEAIAGLTHGNNRTLPEFPLTVSIGIATYPESATDKNELIKRADEALYAAKYSQNKIELYHSVFDDLKSQLDQSEMSLVNTVKTLLTVINAKDRYTYGHSERVVGYAVRVARQLGMSPEEEKAVRIGAFLHDIGKIEVSRDLLNKEEPVTLAEAEIIRQHPVWGAEIVQPVRSLQQVIPIILYHHERHDGKGYPRGLRGEDIPLAARILAVVDSYDAMTTDRPYQGAKSADEAMAELRRCSGTQFDPWVVDAFARVVIEPMRAGRLGA